MLKHLIDRPVSVAMMTLVIIVLGLVSLRHLPVSLIPDIDSPVLTVKVVDDRLSATEIEERALKPLRTQLLQMEGLKDLVSEAKDGNGNIRLLFGYGAKINLLFIEVNERIDRTMSYLGNIPRPKVMKTGASDIPSFYVNVRLADNNDSSYSSPAFLNAGKFVKDVIVRRFEELPEVAMVDASGYAREEIIVRPQEDKMRGFGLTNADLEYAIRSSDIKIGSLWIKDGGYRYNVRFDAKSTSAEEIAGIYLKAGERVLQIKDVAKVSRAASKRNGMVSSDGRPALSLAVIKQSDAKMSDLKKAVSELTAGLRADYPELEFDVYRDQTTLLEYSINSLLQNIIIGILLSCLVIFLFMKDLRSPAIVSLTIPLSLVFSIFCFRIFGLTINIISLSGLILGVGMMTDNTIILIDNITGLWNGHGDLRKAVLEGTEEVTGPMLSSVLTTCAVFLPLVFLNGLAGAMFYDQAVSVAIVLFCSYLVTITVIPVCYYTWYKNKTAFEPSRFLSSLSLDKIISRFDEEWTNWFIDHRKISWAVLLISLFGIFICFGLIKKSRLPQLSETDSVMHIDWNESIDTDENLRRIEELRKVFGGEDFTAFIGVQDFILESSSEQGMNEASVYLNTFSSRALDEETERLGRYLSEKYPKSVYYFESSGNILDLVFAEKEAPVQVRLKPLSHDIDINSLNRVLNEIRNKTKEAVFEPETGEHVLFVADPQLMSLYNIDYNELIHTIEANLNQSRIFEIVSGSDVLPVVAGNDRASLSEILSETFVEKEGGNIPVSLVMKQTFDLGLKKLTAGAEGLYYPLDLSPSDPQKTMDIIRETVRENGEYEVGFTGSYFSNLDMVKDLTIILLVALSLLYLILASQFESLVQPLIILSEIAIDIFAALVVLPVFGVTINLMSMIGLIVITGIVINDSILKIDTINKNRKQGMSLRAAISDASSRRFKAIVMTSLTTILSVAPFLFRGSIGSDLQFPMSIVIVVGLGVGTFVSLFIVPALYYSIYADEKEDK